MNDVGPSAVLTKQHQQPRRDRVPPPPATIPDTNTSIDVAIAIRRHRESFMAVRIGRQYLDVAVGLQKSATQPVHRMDGAHVTERRIERRNHVEHLDLALMQVSHQETPGEYRLARVVRTSVR